MTQPLSILHLEDCPEDAALIRAALASRGMAARIRLAASRDQFLSALDNGPVDLVLSDSSVPGFSGQAALALIRQRHPDVPFIFVSGHDSDEPPKGAAGSPAAAFVSKADLERLAPTIEQLLQATQRPTRPDMPDPPESPSDRLIGVIQELSLARDLDTVMTIVRRAARELTGADGATFVLRDRHLCYYADEDAIAPLWKGSRFPMSACISGWVMHNRQPAVIEDIYRDPRIPVDAYRPTFVKSLAMVPIRTAAPIGAIGNYWARRYQATPDQLRLLQALANSTSIAMENVQLYSELEQRVQQRTEQLEAANRELEAFSYSVSHDLRAPLRHIDGFSQLLLVQSGALLDDDGLDCLARIRRASERMGHLIDDLLRLSRIARTEVRKEAVDLAELAREVASELRSAEPGHDVDIRIEDELPATGDLRLLRVVLENLLSNAWKYSAKTAAPRITVGCTREPRDLHVFYVQDNGAGFDMAYADRLFGPFQRLHPESEFPGTGVGLATVQRIIHKHSGRIWAEASPGEGATFFFTLG